MEAVISAGAQLRQGPGPAFARGAAQPAPSAEARPRRGRAGARERSRAQGEGRVLPLVFRGPPTPSSTGQGAQRPAKGKVRGKAAPRRGFAPSGCSGSSLQPHPLFGIYLFTRTELV